MTNGKQDMRENHNIIGSGELDGWALAKREQKEYDEYCKQFEIDEEDDNFIDSEDI